MPGGCFSSLGERSIGIHEAGSCILLVCAEQLPIARKFPECMSYGWQSFPSRNSGLFEIPFAWSVTVFVIQACSGLYSVLFFFTQGTQDVWCPKPKDVTLLSASLFDTNKSQPNSKGRKGSPKVLVAVRLCAAQGTTIFRG